MESGLVVTHWELSQIDESAAVRSLGETSSASTNPTLLAGVDAHLAAAEVALASGELCAAAEAVQRAVGAGTAAEAAATGWIQAARARASADQSLQLLRAHATVLAASLA